jgi:hypothetical protein
MRQLSGTFLAPLVCLVCLLLVGPVALADAPHRSTRTNPWSGYFPAKGVSCKQEVAKNGVVKGTVRTTVKKKSARKVVTYTPGVGRTTYHLLSRGRLRVAGASTDNSGGYRSRVSASRTLPSPRALVHHKSGQQRVTITMTVPSRVAHLVLQHGRTLRVNGLYRAGGLDKQKMKLADEDKTVVRAVGYRVAMRSFTISNIKPAYRSRLTRELRPKFAELQYTGWVAERLGEVRSFQRNSRGNRWTATSMGCARRTQATRTIATRPTELPDLLRGVGGHAASLAARAVAKAVHR